MENVSPTTALLILLATVSSFIVFAFRDASAHGDGENRRPPILPGSFPIIGHLVQFLWDTEKLITAANTHYGHDTPVRLRLANRRITILNGVSNITSLFKASRMLRNESWVVRALVHAFGIEVSDVPFYLADNTGIGKQALPQSNPIAPEHRIFHLVYAAMHDGLSGARMEELERQFIRNIYTQMMRVEVDEDGAWTDVADLYGSVLRTMCFNASAMSLCGSHILEAVPDLEADFWVFDKYLPSLFREMPQWMAPAAYASRDKMKENMKRWHERVYAAYDISSIETDYRNWEEHFGSKLFRSQHTFFAKMPLSKGTQAALDCGLLWGATANVIPAIGWMVLEAAQYPGLIERVRAEVAPFVKFSPDGGPPDIDLDGLCSQPLVQSMYAEVLRVHNANVVARVPPTAGFSLEGWQFPKNEPIIVSTQGMARTPAVWNAGTPQDPHPLDDFWPTRFIVDPEDMSSGPVLRRAQSEKGEGETPSRPYFSLNGTNGAWIPYGGGSNICPGRHFAKKEMIVATAMFLLAFDVELVPRKERIQQDKSYFMFGVMHPKGAVPARIRRRKTTDV